MKFPKFDIIWDFVAINEKFPNVGFRFKFLKIPLLSITIVWYSNKDPTWKRIHFSDESKNQEILESIAQLIDGRKACLLNLLQTPENKRVLGNVEINLALFELDNIWDHIPKDIKDKYMEFQGKVEMIKK